MVSGNYKAWHIIDISWICSKAMPNAHTRVGTRMYQLLCNTVVGEPINCKNHYSYLLFRELDVFINSYVN